MRFPGARCWRLGRPRFEALLATAVSTSLAAWMTGCTPVIGDSCALSTDCAIDGTRVCDTSQPGGFCTVLNCTGNELGSFCPDNALCISFFPNVPGCPDSVRSPGRMSTAECENTCNSDSDCRASYYCRSPTGPPWNAQILDPWQTAKICLPYLGFVDGGTSPVSYGYVGSPDAIPAVCQPAGPTFDAGFPPLDAATDATDASADARTDAADASRRDAGADAKTDSTLDAGRHDGALDGARDGSHDGRTGGAADGASKDGPPKDGAPKDGASDAHPG